MNNKIKCNINCKCECNSECIKNNFNEDCKCIENINNELNYISNKNNAVKEEQKDYNDLII